MPKYLSKEELLSRHVQRHDDVRILDSKDFRVGTVLYRAGDMVSISIWLPVSEVEFYQRKLEEAQDAS